MANCTVTAVISSTVAGGPYSISCANGSLAASNYDFPSANFATGNLTLTRAPLTVTANDKTRLYGDSNPAFDGTLVGVVAATGDNITASFSSTAVATTGIGSVAITGTLNDPDNRLGNYSVTNNPSTLTINRAHLTVTAVDATRLYGSVNPSEMFTLSGFKNGETPVTANVAGSPTLQTQASAISTVAGSPYTITVVDAGTLTAPNYDFQTGNFVNGRLKVTPTHLSVTADQQTRLYGAANPNLTATIAGFVNGENLGTSGVAGQASCTTTANALSPVIGSYSITCTQGTLSAGNYDFPAANFALGALMITPAHLTVTADPKSRPFGAVDPKFTGTASGFVNGENLGTSGVTGSAACTTTAGALSSVLGGPYSINCTQGALSASNYDFPNFVAGNLTVTTATTKSAVIAPSNQGTGNAAKFTFVATVVSTSGVGTPGGSVTFMDNGTPLAAGDGGQSSKVNLATNGTAAFTTSVGQLTAGQAHSITAVYNREDLNFTNTTAQVAAGVTIGATLTIAPGAAIAAQTLTIVIPSGTTYSSPKCSIVSDFGATVANTSCGATLNGPTLTLQPATNVFGAAQPAPSQAMLRMLNTFGLVLPAVFFLPLAIPASTRKQLLKRRALLLLGLTILLALVVASVGCGGGGFNNPIPLQPGSGNSTATPPGSYTAQATAVDQNGTVTALASIPIKVTF